MQADPAHLGSSLRLDHIGQNPKRIDQGPVDAPHTSSSYHPPGADHAFVESQTPPGSPSPALLLAYRDPNANVFVPVTIPKSSLPAKSVPRTRTPKAGRIPKPSNSGPVDALHTSSSYLLDPWPAENSNRPSRNVARASHPPVADYANHSAPTPPTTPVTSSQPTFTGPKTICRYFGCGKSLMRSPNGPDRDYCTICIANDGFRVRSGKPLGVHGPLVPASVSASVKDTQDALGLCLEGDNYVAVERAKQLVTGLDLASKRCASAHSWSNFMNDPDIVRPYALNLYCVYGDIWASPRNRNPKRSASGPLQAGVPEHDEFILYYLMVDLAIRLRKITAAQRKSRAVVQVFPSPVPASAGIDDRDLLPIATVPRNPQQLEVPGTTQARHTGSSADVSPRSLIAAKPPLTASRHSTSTSLESKTTKSGQPPVAVNSHSVPKKKSRSKLPPMGLDSFRVKPFTRESRPVLSNPGPLPNSVPLPLPNQDVHSRESDAHQDHTFNDNYDLYEGPGPIPYGDPRVLEEQARRRSRGCLKVPITPDASMPSSHKASPIESSVDSSFKSNQSADTFSGGSSKANLLTTNCTKKAHSNGVPIVTPDSKRKRTSTESSHRVPVTALESSIAKRRVTGNAESRESDENETGKEADASSKSSTEPTSVATGKPSRKRDTVKYDGDDFLSLGEAEAPAPCLREKPPIAPRVTGRCGGYAGSITKLNKLKTRTKTVSAPTPATSGFKTCTKTRENLPNDIIRMTVFTKGKSSPRFLYTRESGVAKDGQRESGDFVELPGSNDAEDDTAVNSSRTAADDLVEVPGTDDTGSDPFFKSETHVRKEVKKEKQKGSQNAPIELSSGSESDSDEEPDEPEGFDGPCDDVAIALDEPSFVCNDLTLDEHYRLSTHQALEDLLATGNPSSAQLNTLWQNILNQYSLDQEFNAFKKAQPAPQRATARRALKLWVVLHSALAQFRDDTQFYGRPGEEWRQHTRMLMAIPGREEWRNALEARRKLRDLPLAIEKTGGWLEGGQFARALADFFSVLIRHGWREHLEERFLAYNKNLCPWFGFFERGDVDMD
ncbi:uncharacterized protein CC84DRAFT_1253825 [Paraphaeosphaeria sporulosa]|uniref:Uncharacterized protein n=1 Tax=Paraphaeosphaeria sporulosa TaxID=1460663 RepID=A0A177CWD4_9PLEO|nr:uncharacterized protein CC84DRAFT_1253825 [Paraphaeosphaeria sporulosa]OAG11348.1 hypothetical protein CC84DRAFT_1253825 [Paraphaeosphaeria sporulosa]